MQALYPSATIAALAAIAALAGMAKGLTGFGGALVMAPLFSLLIAVPDAGVLIVLVHAATSLQGWRQWKAQANWRAVVPLGVVAVLCAGACAHAFAHVDVRTTRRLLACAVLAATAMHLAGWRWRHGGGWIPTLGAGLASGALTALGGLGGPPAFYYFAGGASGVSLRANLLGFFALLFCGSVAALALEGRVSFAHVTTAVWLLPAFAAGVTIGERAGRRLPARWFDRAVTALLFASAMVALLS
ncbi:sulfite exporter TauE/SafE family protein [Paraburkholderia sp. J41]|uniref:sulfite exporter TauE/SafE family protein n=1 Tax=Paraburkholderia sp. J41 TaxID=2805433 RepID=UPI002AC327A0|nr:sulfite exporter TauE/SafE family protein [Paraburkholderia sp. J41]